LRRESKNSTLNDYGTEQKSTFVDRTMTAHRSSHSSDDENTAINNDKIKILF
jgi:hypothetical protein